MTDAVTHMTLASLENKIAIRETRICQKEFQLRIYFISGLEIIIHVSYLWINRKPV